MHRTNSYKTKRYTIYVTVEKVTDVATSSCRSSSPSDFCFRREIHFGCFLHRFVCVNVSLRCFVSHFIFSLLYFRLLIELLRIKEKRKKKMFILWREHRIDWASFTVLCMNISHRIVQFL